jgi:hypothetical protein
MKNRSFARKITPKVKKGKVQKKNNHQITPNFWNVRQKDLIIDIQKTGEGFKHFLKKRDIKNFIELLPNWNELSEDLDAIILAKEELDAQAWYNNGVIGICPWEKELTVEWRKRFFEDHKALLDRLGVEYQVENNYVICYFTEAQVKSYQLLHLLLHELGHHHDKLTTKSRVIGRGEPYAENYAFKYEELIWNRFFENFEICW